jgi:hypothetical protein
MKPKLLLGLALVLSGALSSAAQPSFEYITTNGQVTITAHISDDKSVIIPDADSIYTFPSKFDIARTKAKNGPLWNKP